MASSTLKLAITAAATMCALAMEANGATVYSLASDGTSLIRFDSATPGAVTTVGTIGGATDRLDGLDFRPSDGLLYGYNHATGSAYNVSTTTGAVTLAATLSTPTNTNFLGIDFNPVPDRLRIVTGEEQNLRVNLAGGGTIVDGTLAYAAGDVNSGVRPEIIDAAYTNSFLGMAASTALYYIDYGLDTLVTTSNPNGGILNTIGSLGFDFDANAGLDIFSNLGSNSAFAALRVGGVNGFYGIDLSTGAASLVGVIGDQSFMYGLAVAPGLAVTAVPEPSSLALMGVGALGLFAARRRSALKQA